MLNFGYRLCHTELELYCPKKWFLKPGIQPPSQENSDLVPK